MGGGASFENGGRAVAGMRWEGTGDTLELCSSRYDDKMAQPPLCLRPPLPSPGYCPSTSSLRARSVNW